MTTETRKFQPNAAALIGWSGLAAVAAGLIFAGIQPIHPLDLRASVTTEFWAVIIGLKFAMCLLFLVGITAIYAKQAAKVGWLGLAGFVLLIVSWWLQTGFVFVDGYVLPVLASAAPGFIDSYLGMVNPASPSTMDIGALPGLYGVVGITYMLGGLTFGIATFRAGMLPRSAAILLAVAAVATPFAALLPHEIQRFAAIPTAIALGWLGYAVWAGRRAGASVPAVIGLGQAAR